MGPWGIAISITGGAVILAPLYIMIEENIKMMPVVSYKKKIVASGIAVDYEPCEGDKEYIRSFSDSGKLEKVTVCTQKSRTQIGEVSYLLDVLHKSSEVPLK
jgi:hypothetical protein